MRIDLQVQALKLTITDDNGDKVLAFSVQDYALSAKPDALISAIGTTMAKILEASTAAQEN